MFKEWYKQRIPSNPDPIVFDDLKPPSSEKEFLISFLIDWYKDNPMIDEYKIGIMVDKYLNQIK